MNFILFNLMIAYNISINFSKCGITATLWSRWVFLLVDLRKCTIWISNQVLIGSK